LKKKGAMAIIAMKEMGCQNFDDIRHYMELWIWDCFTREKNDNLDEQEFSRQKAKRDEEHVKEFGRCLHLNFSDTTLAVFNFTL
jgi:hypothetical protein